MCVICNCNARAEIENALLEINIDAQPGEPGSLESIAQQYSVSLNDLKMHALFHTPLVSSSDLAAVVSTDCSSTTVSAPRDSLSRKMKLREIDMLTSVSNEYLVTLKTVGRRINRLAQTSSIDEEDQDNQVRLAKLLTKPMVDLYVGLGSEIRQTIKTMAEVDRLLNGPEQNAGAGLVALAEVLRNSSPGEAE